MTNKNKQWEPDDLCNSYKEKEHCFEECEKHKKDIKKRNIARNRKLDSIFSEVLKLPELDGGNQYD